MSLKNTSPLYVVVIVFVFVIVVCVCVGGGGGICTVSNESKVCKTVICKSVQLTDLIVQRGN